MDLPHIILLFSGKRKSGKDYLAEKVYERLTDEKCQILRISEPIKSYYAKLHNLDLQQLMSDGKYKETYRINMIIWSDEMRSKDYGYFCKAACANAAVKPIWIVSDIRRKNDIKWFREKYGARIKTIRVNADEQVRRERGWVFTEGVDDVSSECDLDDVTEWDYVYSNNDSSKALSIVESIVKSTESTI